MGNPHTTSQCFRMPRCTTQLSHTACSGRFQNNSARCHLGGTGGLPGESRARLDFLTAGFREVVKEQKEEQKKKRPALYFLLLSISSTCCPIYLFKTTIFWIKMTLGQLRNYRSGYKIHFEALKASMLARAAESRLGAGGGYKSSPLRGAPCSGHRAAGTGQRGSDTRLAPRPPARPQPRAPAFTERKQNQKPRFHRGNFPQGPATFYHELMVFPLQEQNKVPLTFSGDT